jgi:peptide/nickel transport system substrate-binding protein
MLTAEQYGEPRPYQYPVGGTWYNLEQDYKVWGGHNHEEFATAGILWDLHDGGVETNQGFMSGDGYVGTVSRVYNQTTDSVSLRGSDIIKALQTSRAKTLVGVYVASIPSVSTENLDMVFLNHGAFADIVERNYIHDAWNETISQTGNTANRMVRFSPVPELPGSYIVADDNVLLEVAFKHVQPFGQYDYSYTVNMTAGEPAYFSMPPPYYPSKAVFSQVSDDGEVIASNITTVDSAEYWSYIDSGPGENATFRTIQVSDIVPVSSGSTTPPPEGGNQAPPAQPAGGGCLIATAAFGSELTPQVQFLRSFRDNHILSTASGASFMNVFNAWYYSFSPQVADYERQQPWLQQAVRIAIYPLLGILQVAEKAYAILPGEFGSVSAGLVASSLIGSVYLTPLALLIRRVRESKLDLRILLAIAGSAVVAVTASVMTGHHPAMMVTTSILVVSTLVIATLFASRIINSVANRLRSGI